MILLNNIKGYLNRNPIIGVCLSYYLLMSVAVPGFFGVNNSWNLVYNFIPILILAVGQTFVILTAGIDLSIASIIAVCSVAGGYLMSDDTGLFGNPFTATMVGVVGMLAVGAAIGFINGLAVAKLKMPAFMVTLTTLMFFSGMAIWLTRSQSIYNLPALFVDAPYKTFLGLPSPVYLGVLVVLVCYFLLNKTIWGAWIYSVGTNIKTSWISGVNISLVLISVYVINGLCASLGSLIYTARLETGSPVMGQNILLDVIGAVIIGGTSLFGGKGKLQWTAGGALLMTMLDNSLNLVGLSFFLIMMVKGAIIHLTALYNQQRSNAVIHA
jgi:ribose transport system permease protein